MRSERASRGCASSRKQPVQSSACCARQTQVWRPVLRGTPMSIVAGVDFGTLSVRVSLFDSAKGRLGSGVAEYPLFRKPDDPDHATQRHADHMTALVQATHRAIADAKIEGSAVETIA